MRDLQHHLCVEGVGKAARDTPQVLASPFYNGALCCLTPMQTWGNAFNCTPQGSMHSL